MMDLALELQKTYDELFAFICSQASPALNGNQQHSDGPDQHNQPESGSDVQHHRGSFCFDGRRPW
jgi:hypothetical protein